MIKLLRTFGLLLIASLLACGKGEVQVTNTSYEPKIAIEGWIMPHHRVDDIKISQNFPLDANLRTYIITPDPDETRVKIIEERTGQEFELNYQHAESFDDKHWEYEGDDLVIEYGESYTLDVTATVEGKRLHAWAKTTVPAKGYRIVGVNHDQLPYRPLDEDGEPINFEVEIERSPGTTFYLATVRPLEASSANFVYDNPFTDMTPEEVDDEIRDYDFEYGWIQNTPTGPGRSSIQTFWFVMWFYGRYEIIVYASDDNYEDFMQTYDEVQEEDGNFHEPVFDIQGDGIGVFGSVVPDTIYVDVVK